MLRAIDLEYYRKMLYAKYPNIDAAIREWDRKKRAKKAKKAKGKK